MGDEETWRTRGNHNLGTLRNRTEAGVKMVGRGRNMPTFVEGNIEERAFSGQADNNSSSAFDYESISVRCCVGFVTRSVGLEHSTVREDMEW